LRAGLGVLDKGETLEPGRVWAFANGRGDWSDKGNAQGDGAETVNARERAAYLVAQGVRQVLAGGPLAQAQRDALEALAARVEPLEAQAQAARAERVRIAAELEAAERLERERETRESWIAGGAVRFYGRDALGGAYLRAVGVERNESGDITGGTLETSQGANVPLVHALRAFRFLKHCRETGTPWQRNGRTIRVGFYHVDSVAPDGSFVAGCHRINWPQVEVVALALGVADLAPDSSVATPTNATA